MELDQEELTKYALSHKPGWSLTIRREELLGLLAIAEQYETLCKQLNLKDKQ